MLANRRNAPCIAYLHRHSKLAVLLIVEKFSQYRRTIAKLSQRRNYSQPETEITRACRYGLSLGSTIKLSFSDDTRRSAFRARCQIPSQPRRNIFRTQPRAGVHSGSFVLRILRTPSRTPFLPSLSSRAICETIFATFRVQLDRISALSHRLQGS